MIKKKARYVKPPNGWKCEVDSGDFAWSRSGLRDSKVTLNNKIFGNDTVVLYLYWTEEGWVVIPVEHYEAVKVFLESL